MTVSSDPATNPFVSHRDFQQVVENGQESHVLCKVYLEHDICSLLPILSNSHQRSYRHLE